MAKNFIPENYPWSVRGLKKCIKENRLKDVEILIETDSAAIVYVPNYESSVVLGANANWCISQHRCSWEQYVSNENNVQIFFYNFSPDAEYELSLVGATYALDDTGSLGWEPSVFVTCSFTKSDKELFKFVQLGTDDDAVRCAIVDVYGDGVNERLKDIILKRFFIGKTEKKEEDGFEKIDDRLGLDFETQGQNPQSRVESNDAVSVSTWPPTTTTVADYDYYPYIIGTTNTY